VRLNQHGLVALRDCHFAHLVQEHGFSHAAQPDHEQALFCTAGFGACKQKLCTAQQVCTARQLRRLIARARGKRVGQWIHID